MREITQDILQIIDDLQMMRSKQDQNGVGEAAEDRYGYPFEPSNAFSTKPLEFAETALRLDIETGEMFKVLRTVNRLSPLFYQLSGQFEKLLRQLGSCCITKAVIEQQENETFELLQDLTIEHLREMAAFNFRKCFAAFVDCRSRGKYHAGALSLSVRWAALDKRLIATEEKIRRFQVSGVGCQEESDQWPVVSDQNELPANGEIRNQISEIRNEPPEGPDRTQDPVPGGQMPVDDEQSISQCNEDSEFGNLPVSALAEKGRAFPVLGEIRNQRSEIGNEASDQWSVVSDQNELPADGWQEDSDQRSVAREIRNKKSEIRNVAGDQCPVASDQNEMQVIRQVLLGDALDRGDREAYEAAAQAADEGLEALWQAFFLRDMRDGFPFLRKIGLIAGEPEEPPPEEAMEEDLIPEFAIVN